MEASEFSPKPVSEPPKPPEGSKRERLSDEEMGNLLSAVGNHEAKAITLGLMQLGHIYSRQGLQNLINFSQGEKPGWIMGTNTPFDYCRSSLAPIGFVAQEIMDSDLSTYGYMKTPRGEKQGDVLAGLILDYSLRHPEFSVQDLFGPTVASRGKSVQIGDMEFKKRAPVTRLKIFWELLTSDLPIDRGEIVKQIGQSSSVIDGHLRGLFDTGIISKKSPEGRSLARGFYKAGVNEQDYVGRGGERAEFVLRIIRSDPNKEFSAEEVVDRFMSMKEGQESQEERTKITQAIYAVLTGLDKQGYVNKIKKGGRTNRHFSEIDLPDQSINAVFDLVNTIDKFQSQDPETIAFGKRKLAEILADSTLIASLMEKARQHSYKAVSVSKEDTNQAIKDFIIKNPEATLRDIQRNLRIDGRSRGRVSINNGLKRLLGVGDINFDVVKGVRRYSVAEKQQQLTEE